MANQSLNHKNIFQKKKKIFLSKLTILFRLYKSALYLRLFEEKLSKEYHPANQMQCPVHFCIGQEAVPSALKLILKKNDYVFSHHRSHGYFYSKSLPLQKLVSELYGKKGGAKAGFAGSQDISYPKGNFFSGAILAGAIGVAVGKALDMKLNNKTNVVIAGFGESACDVGLFWEAINFSNLKKLPILFICENNNYSVFSPQNKRQSGHDIFQKVQKFSLRTNSFQVDGNNIDLVYRTIKKLIKLIKKKQGPFFLETITYRISPHYGPNSDLDVGYRSERELNKWINKCPIKNLENFLINKKYLSRAKIADIQNKYSREIKSYIDNAKKDKFLSAKNLEKFNYDFNSFEKIKIKKISPPNYNLSVNSDKIIGY